MATQTSTDGSGIAGGKAAGTPLVFIHGNVGDGRLWQAQCAAAGGRYRCLAPSLRYFGAAPWPDDGAGYSAQAHVDDLAALIAGLDAGPAHLVGWSYGAALALSLALRQPRLVRSLFLYEPISASALADPAEAETAIADRKALAARAVATIEAGDCAAAVERLVDDANGQPGSFAALPSPVQAIAADNGRVLPLIFRTPLPAVGCAQLGEISLPTLVASGERTRPFYRLVAAAVGRCIPHSRQLVVPGARHFWPIEDPAAFSAALSGFLDGLD